MPAMRFFSLLVAGRKLFARSEAWRAVYSIDASSVALGDSKYFEDLRRYYSRLAVGKDEEEESPRSRALDPTSQEAKVLITDLFEQAQRFT